MGPLTTCILHICTTRSHRTSLFRLPNFHIHKQTHKTGFSAEQLSSLLWSLASLNYIPGTPLLEAAAAALLANLALCAPQQAAQVRVYMCICGGASFTSCKHSCL